MVALIRGNQRIKRMIIAKFSLTVSVGTAKTLSQVRRLLQAGASRSGSAVLQLLRGQLDP